jgi:hypothetical protein
MKTFLLLLALLAGGMVVGCTPTETAAERNHRINSVWEMDLREMNEDWDRIWLLERNEKDNQWAPHAGM